MEFIPGQLFEYNAPANYTMVDFDNIKTMSPCVVDILIDNSSSVYNFQSELAQALKNAKELCEKGKFRRNLIFRMSRFNTDIGIEEIFGYIPIADLTDDMLPTTFQCMTASGNTAFTNLRWAIRETLKAGINYCYCLEDREKSPTYLLIVLSDGEDTEDQGKFNIPIGENKRSLQKARDSKKFQSLSLILFGINVEHCEENLRSIAVQEGVDIMKLDLDSKNWKGFEELFSSSVAVASQGVTIPNSGAVDLNLS